ncbi:MAG: protein translocase subunit SecD [Myxococcales bacterium]|nr:protein translocase subunit SecD [Myxococcales bacterium]
MDRTWWTRFLLIIVVALGSLWFLTPTYYSMFVLDRADRNDVAKLEKALPSWAAPAKYRLSLGLDLQGGIHLVLRVDTKTALGKRAQRLAQQMISYIDSKKLGKLTETTNTETYEVTLTAEDPATMDAIEKELIASFQDFSKVSRNAGVLVMKLESAQVDSMMSESVDQAMLVVRKRIDKWGVAEVDVRKLGTDSIQISLPGEKDPERAKELIGTTAQLEFKIVEEHGDLFKDLYSNTPPDPNAGITLVTSRQDSEGNEPTPPFLSGTDKNQLLAYVAGKGGEGKQVILHCVEAPSGKSCLRYTTFLVQSTGLSGENLTGADARKDQTTNDIVVDFQFNAQGGKLSEEFTGKNVNRLMGVILDDNLISAPVIREKIGANGRITLGKGRSDERLKEAQMLSLSLKSGALPAPVSIGETRQVGASLGDELIKKGTTAAVVGLLLVVLFMAIYYKVAGLVADVALVLNALLILAGLALFKATLTLPGIAGFVLTLGIAVDANVLINERIREELGNGKSARVAVDQGYDRAFWTIFDAHVTTLIAGFILQQTGTGPIQGFATTLIIGIIASLFTSIVVTRVLTTYLVHGRNAQTVSI